MFNLTQEEKEDIQHRINNPLTIIVACTNYLKNKNPEKEFDIILEAVNRITKYVKEISQK